MGGVAEVYVCRYTDSANMGATCYDNPAEREFGILPRWGAALLRPYNGVSIAPQSSEV